MPGIILGIDMKFPLAIASYSFHGLVAQGHLNLLGYLELLHSRYQIRQADIWTGLLKPSDLESDYLKAIRRYIDERQIELANICIDGPNLWEYDPEERRANRLTMLRYIDAAKQLGARTIRVDFGGGAETMPEEAFEGIATQYWEYCQICAEDGIRIGPENHFGWDQIPDNLRRVRDAVNHPAYGHLLHVGNWPKGQGSEMLEICLPVLMHTHFPADQILWTKGLISRISRTGYSGAYSVEHHSGCHELERVLWQLGVMRGHLAELSQEGNSLTNAAGFFCQIAQGIPADGIL